MKRIDQSMASFSPLVLLMKKLFFFFFDDAHRLEKNASTSATNKRFETDKEKISNVLFCFEFDDNEIEKKCRNDQETMTSLKILFDFRPH